jgi:hypothetical protein
MKLFNQKSKHTHVWTEHQRWRYRECSCGAFEALVGPYFLGKDIVPARWVPIRVNKKALDIVDRKIALINTQHKDRSQ